MAAEATTTAEQVPALGLRIRSLREGMDLSLRELATRCGVSAPMHEPGSRETVLVTTGAVTFSCDGIDHDLREGDAVTFDADLPHHFVNPAKEEAVLLGVLSAGLR